MLKSKFAVEGPGLPKTLGPETSHCNNPVVWGAQLTISKHMLREHPGF